jgi:phosphoribosylanthranilate isomerase
MAGRVRLKVKVCGVTRPEDARAAAGEGADAIGINLWPASKRYAAPEVARAVARAIPDGVLRFGVFVDADKHDVVEARDELGLHYLQLHGDEAPALLDELGETSFKAVRLSGQDVVDGLHRWPGPFVLVDAYRAGAPGGTGELADWDLARQAARRRTVWLAGGLRPENVAAAVAQVRPYGVDVASGVEASPGVKDPTLVRAFIQAAHTP